jgi:hypothetical protein
MCCLCGEWRVSDKYKKKSRTYTHTCMHAFFFRIMTTNEEKTHILEFIQRHCHFTRGMHQFKYVILNNGKICGFVNDISNFSPRLSNQFDCICLENEIIATPNEAKYNNSSPDLHKKSIIKQFKNMFSFNYFFSPDSFVTLHNYCIFYDEYPCGMIKIIDIGKESLKDSLPLSTKYVKADMSLRHHHNTNNPFRMKDIDHRDLLKHEGRICTLASCAIS